MDVFSIIMVLDYLADASLSKYKADLVKLKNSLTASYNQKSADLNTWITRVQNSLDELNINIPNIASHLKGELIKKKDSTLKEIDKYNKTRSALDADFSNSLDQIDRKLNTRGLANVFDQVGHVVAGNPVPESDKFAQLFVDKSQGRKIESSIGGK